LTNPLSACRSGPSDRTTVRSRCSAGVVPSLDAS
jgi:hypothetical protein